MKITALCLAAGFIALAAPSWAATPMSEADCTALWTKADKNTDGSLATADEGMAFSEKMKAGNMTTKDPAMITKEEFMEHCTKGDFEGVKMPE